MGANLRHASASAHASPAPIRRASSPSLTLRGWEVVTSVRASEGEDGAGEGEGDEEDRWRLDMGLCEVAIELEPTRSRCKALKGFTSFWAPPGLTRRRWPQASRQRPRARLRSSRLGPGRETNAQLTGAATSPCGWAAPGWIGRRARGGAAWWPRRTPALPRPAPCDTSSWPGRLCRGC